MEYKIKHIQNGNTLESFYTYYCEECGCELPENIPQYVENEDKETEIHYCGDCAFIKSLINTKTFMKDFLYFLPSDIYTPIIQNGKVEIVTIAYLNAVKKDKIRNTTEYKKWRKAIYERDNYTCQICGQKGGKLNAHHIKPFAKFKNLRTELNNGITLCENCHKLLHRKEGINARLD